MKKGEDTSRDCWDTNSSKNIIYYFICQPQLSKAEKKGNDWFSNFFILLHIHIVIGTYIYMLIYERAYVDLCLTVVS